MIGGEEFIEATDKKLYYMESCIKLLIYGYHKIVQTKKSYSRATIHKKIKERKKNKSALNEIEDYLCTDLINNFAEPHKKLFQLNYFVISAGVRETDDNITVGELDVKFQPSTLDRSHYYIFEAKRINGYAAQQNYYITGGIKRFTDKTYYPESDMTVAGMIGFVEVDLSKHVKKKRSITEIKDSINRRITNNESFETTQLLQQYFVTDDRFIEINKFGSLYLSKHIRIDKEEILIHHLFFDYYEILVA